MQSLSFQAYFFLSGLKNDKYTSGELPPYTVQRQLTGDLNVSEVKCALGKISAI